MALTVQGLIDDVARELQDHSHTRWPRSDLLGYFNAGQRAFAQLRPDEMAHERELELVEGWRQRVPDDALVLIEITNNINARSRRVRRTDTWVLDALVADWRSLAPAPETVHYMHDARSPREFLVYPPAAAGIKLRAVVAVLPPDLTDEASAPSVPVRWMDALRHFVLARAWAVDAEFAGNAALSAAHLQLFYSAIGVNPKE